MSVSNKGGTPESSIFSLGFLLYYFHHPFWDIPTFWKHPKRAIWVWGVWQPPIKLGAFASGATKSACLLATVGARETQGVWSFRGGFLLVGNPAGPPEIEVLHPPENERLVHLQKGGSPGKRRFPFWKTILFRSHVLVLGGVIRLY